MNICKTADWQLISVTYTSQLRQRNTSWFAPEGLTHKIQFGSLTVLKSKEQKGISWLVSLPLKLCSFMINNILICYWWWKHALRQGHYIIPYCCVNEIKSNKAETRVLGLDFSYERTMPTLANIALQKNWSLFTDAKYESMTCLGNPSWEAWSYDRGK